MKPTRLFLLLGFIVISYFLFGTGGPILVNVTSGGGVYSDGKIIEFRGGDTTLAVRISSQQFGFHNLMQASNGKIYANSGNAIIEFDLATGSLQTPVVYPSLSGVGKLLEASDGKLYGIADQNLAKNYIISYTIGADSVVVLDTFPSSIYYLFNGMIQSSNGKLYGISDNDGSNQGGTIYEYDIASNTISVLVNLPTNADPAGPLVEVGTDTLYGMTYSDGLYGRGTIFRYVIATGAYDTLYNVPALNTCNAGALILASDGKLYGTISDNYVAGVHYYGSIFSFNRYSNTYTDLYDVKINDLSKGGSPGTLFQASDGMIYGVMEGYGNGWSGSIFQFNINTDSLVTEVVLDSFTTGINPGTFIEYYPWLGTGVTTIPEANIKIYGKTGAVVIERPDATPATVIVTNLLGQQVINTNINNASITLPASTTNTIYIVQVIQGSTQTIRKIFVK